MLPLDGQGEPGALLAGGFECVEDLPVEDSIDILAGKERWRSWARQMA